MSNTQEKHSADHEPEAPLHHAPVEDATHIPVDATHTMSDAAAKAASDAHAAIRKLKADVVITRHIAVASSAGLIPVPLVDFAAVTTVQLAMLALICDIYETPFSKEAATTIIASLVGGGLTYGQAGSMAMVSRLKFIPVIGTVVSMVLTPAVAGVTTYAIGKVFVSHLESGGNLLNFQVAKMKEYMEKALQEGKRFVPRWGVPPVTAAAQ